MFFVHQFIRASQLEQNSRDKGIAPAIMAQLVPVNRSVDNQDHCFPAHQWGPHTNKSINNKKTIQVFNTHSLAFVFPASGSHEFPTSILGITACHHARYIWGRPLELRHSSIANEHLYGTKSAWFIERSSSKETLRTTNSQFSGCPFDAKKSGLVEY